jgi:hypothetical protein
MNKSTQTLFFTILILLNACKKTEELAPSSAGLIVLGDDNDIELVALESDPDGGFVVGSNSRTFENKQIRVTKYSSNFRMNWDKYAGGPMSNKLFQLHYDKDQNLVVAGLTYGYGADTLSLSEHKFWWPYIAIFDANGDSIWGKGIEGLATFAGAGSGREERITRIAQDNVGNFYFAGEFAYRTSIRSTVGRISPDGELLSVYSAQPNLFGKIDAFLIEDNRYTSFGFWRESDSSSAHAGLFKNIANDTSGSDNYVDQSIGPWPFGESYDVGIVGSIQHEPLNGIWQVDYIFTNACYRYEINLSSGDINGGYIDFPFNSIRFVKRVDKNSILLADATGVVYECDNDFKPILSFKTDWNVKLATKLNNGEFVLAAQRGKDIYLIHYSQDGKVIENES